VIKKLQTLRQKKLKREEDLILIKVSMVNVS